MTFVLVLRKFHFEITHTLLEIAAHRAVGSVPDLKLDCCPPPKIRGFKIDFNSWFKIAILLLLVHKTYAQIY